MHGVENEQDCEPRGTRAVGLLTGISTAWDSGEFVSRRGMLFARPVTLPVP